MDGTFVFEILPLLVMFFICYFYILNINLKKKEIEEIEKNRDEIDETDESIEIEKSIFKKPGDKLLVIVIFFLIFLSLYLTINMFLLSLGSLNVMGFLAVIFFVIILYLANYRLEDITLAERAKRFLVAFLIILAASLYWSFI